MKRFAFPFVRGGIKRFGAQLRADNTPSVRLVVRLQAA
jgi:hypothetical protein